MKKGAWNGPEPSVNGITVLRAGNPFSGVPNVAGHATIQSLKSWTDRFEEFKAGQCQCIGKPGFKVTKRDRKSKTGD